MSTRPRRIQKPTWAERAVVTDRHVAGAVLQFVGVCGRGCIVSGLIIGELTVAGIAEDRAFKLVAIIEAERQFACVRIHSHRRRKVPERPLGPSWNGGIRTQVGGVPKLSEAIVVGVPLRIERSEEEKVILEMRNVAANFAIDVVLTLVQDIAQEVEALLCATLLIVGK